MGELTKIEWTDHTFNHVVGCQKVSPGCAHCYAETQTQRFGKDFKVRRRTSPANWRQVERWNKSMLFECPGCGVRADHPTVCVTPGCNTFTSEMNAVRPRVFCASMADWLDDRDVVIDAGKPTERIDRGGVETLADLLDLIRRTPNLDWLLLTKRPENWKQRMEEVIAECVRGDSSQNVRWLDGTPPPNVWVMWSAEDQKRWDERAPHGLAIPAVVHGVSVEPMLERIEMNGNWYLSGHARRQDKSLMPAGTHKHIDWVIFGGESGTKARPCNVEWIRDGVRQCREAGVKAFCKQLGENAKGSAGADYTTKDRKGGDPAEWPEDLRVREWPEGGVE